MPFSVYLPITLTKSNGDLIYENRLARELFGHGDALPSSIIPSLTTATLWDDVRREVVGNQPLLDRPALIQTPHSPADLCYLTVLPEPGDTKDSAIWYCIWSARRYALRLLYERFEQLSQAQTGETGAEYTRDLEAMIEHRTFQQLLAAERSEQARDVLDLLPVGVLVVAPAGEVVYRNLTMQDIFGLRLNEYPESHIRCFLPETVGQALKRVVETGMRAYVKATDPVGKPADIDLLPVIKTGQVVQVALQFSRSRAGASA